MKVGGFLFEESEDTPGDRSGFCLASYYTTNGAKQKLTGGRPSQNFNNKYLVEK
jgi:hypothetical protein